MSAADGFVYPGGVSTQEYSRYEPVKGVGADILRSSSGNNNSAIYLLKYDGGAAALAPPQALPFQFDAGVAYHFTLNIENDTLTITVTNGATTYSTSVPLNGFALLKDQIFVEDEQSGDDGCNSTTSW